MRAPLFRNDSTYVAKGVPLQLKCSRCKLKLRQQLRVQCACRPELGARAKQLLCQLLQLPLALVVRGVCQQWRAHTRI